MCLRCRGDDPVQVNPVSPPRPSAPRLQPRALRLPAPSSEAALAPRTACPCKTTGGLGLGNPGGGGVVVGGPDWILGCRTYGEVEKPRLLPARAKHVLSPVG